MNLDHTAAFRGEVPSEEEADEVVTDMVAELGIAEPPVEMRLQMRAAVLKVARLLLARGWRVERPPPRRALNQRQTMPGA